MFSLLSDASRSFVQRERERADSSARVRLFVAGLDLAPADEAEVSVHFATQGDLVADLGADKLRQQNTRLFLAAHNPY